MAGLYIYIGKNLKYFIYKRTIWWWNQYYKIISLWWQIHVNEEIHNFFFNQLINQLIIRVAGLTSIFIFRVKKFMTYGVIINNTYSKYIILCWQLIKMFCSTIFNTDIICVMRFVMNEQNNFSLKKSLVIFNLI